MGTTIDKSLDSSKRKGRVLLVDDDSNLLQSLRTSLRRALRGWEFVTCPSGWDALEQLENGPWDAMVSDFRMPGMDGAQLLSKVKSRKPDMLRFILTGQATDEDLLRTLPCAHQVFSKPSDGRQLARILESTCRRLWQAPADMQSTITGSSMLLTAQESCARFVRCVQDPDSNIGSIREAVLEDLGLTIKVFHMAHSRLDGAPNQVMDFSEAIHAIGVADLCTLAVEADGGRRSSSASSPMRGELLRTLALWARSAEALLDGFAGSKDIQRLAMAASKLQFSGVLLSLEASEREGANDRPAHWGQPETHAASSGSLLTLWGLPEALVQTVAPDGPDPLPGAEAARAAMQEATRMVEGVLRQRYPEQMEQLDLPPLVITPSAYTPEAASHAVDVTLGLTDNDRRASA